MKYGVATVCAVEPKSREPTIWFLLAMDIEWETYVCAIAATLRHTCFIPIIYTKRLLCNKNYAEYTKLKRYQECVHILFHFWDVGIWNWLLAEGIEFKYDGVDQGRWIPHLLTQKCRLCVKPLILTVERYYIKRYKSQQLTNPHCTELLG